MGIFDKIQTNLDSLIEIKETIGRLERQIIQKTIYIGERLVGEEEFEGAIKAKKRDEEHNRKTNSEIQSAKEQYNQKFDELCDFIESKEGALQLPSGLVLARSGNSFEVYNHDTEYKIAQSYVAGQSQFKKLQPDVYKRF